MISAAGLLFEGEEDGFADNHLGGFIAGDPVRATDLPVEIFKRHTFRCMAVLLAFGSTGEEYMQGDPVQPEVVDGDRGARRDEFLPEIQPDPLIIENREEFFQEFQERLPGVGTAHAGPGLPLRVPPYHLKRLFHSRCVNPLGAGGDKGCGGMNDNQSSMTRQQDPLTIWDAWKSACDACVHSSGYSVGILAVDTDGDINTKECIADHVYTKGTWFSPAGYDLYFDQDFYPVNPN